MFKKDIFLIFFKIKNILLGFFLSIILISLLYSFIPIGYLTYGVFNFIQVFLLLSILLINVDTINFLKKKSGKYFYANLLFSMILFMIPIAFFIIFTLFVYQLFIPNASFWSSLLIQMPTIIQWSLVNWYILAYIYLLNILIIFSLFLLLKDLKKLLLTNIFVIFLIIFLFTGGFFIGFYIDKTGLSSDGVKIINQSDNFFFIKIFSWLNPFYWINAMSSTLFLTSGIFANYNEFSFSLSDLFSFFTIFAPIFFLISFLSIYKIKDFFVKI